MPDNRNEIVRLAVEWAEDVLSEDGPLRYDSDQRRARGILALASPPEPPKPKRHPGIDAEPSTVHDELRRGLLVLCDNGECHIRGPIRNTPAAAVAAWNEMIDRISVADEETVNVVQDARYWMIHHGHREDHPSIQRIDRWLAERTGGADGR